MSKNDFPLTVGTFFYGNELRLLSTIHSLQSQNITEDLRLVEVLLVVPFGEVVTQRITHALNLLSNQFLVHIVQPSIEVFHPSGFRDFLFCKAQAPYVLCLEAGIQIFPETLIALHNYFSNNPTSSDLLQGFFQLKLHGETYVSKQGSWSFTDQKSAITSLRWSPQLEPEDSAKETQEITTQQHLGLFACRRDAWLGFNPRFRGLGGEEGYLHTKFRQVHQRVFALPCLLWKYDTDLVDSQVRNVYWFDLLYNYAVGYRELGKDLKQLEVYLEKSLPSEFTKNSAFSEIWQQVCTQIENPFQYFDAIYCLNLDAQVDRWNDMCQRFQRLGILDRVRRFPAIETPESHHIGCTLSFRTMLEIARTMGWENVLVLEDDAIVRDDALACLERSITELDGRSWELLYLGGTKWRVECEKVEGCQYLDKACTPLTSCHAVAFHESVFDKILSDIPGEMTAFKHWILKELAIDQYLNHISKRLVTFPVLVTQPVVLSMERPEDRDRFS